jgi:S-adenosylmethionine synthetase
MYSPPRIGGLGGRKLNECKRSNQIEAVIPKVKVDRKLQVTVRFQAKAMVRFQKMVMGKQHQEMVIANLSQYQQRQER